MTSNKLKNRIIEILELHNHKVSGASLNWAEKIKEDFEKVVLPKEKRYTEFTVNQILTELQKETKQAIEKEIDELLEVLKNGKMWSRKKLLILLEKKKKEVIKDI